MCASKGLVLAWSQRRSRTQLAWGGPAHVRLPRRSGASLGNFAGALFDSNAKALGDGCNAIALAAVSSTADTTVPVPTCTGDLALAARTNDAAFCLHAAGLVLAG